jgi:hypothetical protein
MSKQAGSRSAERDLLFFRPAAMANAIATRESSTQDLKPMLNVSGQDVRTCPWSDDSWQEILTSTCIDFHGNR